MYSVGKNRIKEVAWEPTEEWLAAQRARTGDKNPMFGRKMSEAGLIKMRAGWARRRALGLKMNLTEEQRELRRAQASAMRHTLLLKRASVQNG
jgi:hypothetical protein